jgi:GNAT superfamily N-acetyltransferase
MANPEVSGVIFILPPGHTKISLMEYIRCGFLFAPFALGLSGYKRSMECEDFVARTHGELMKDRQHYYLWGLAVRPGEKRKGIGSALMEPVLAKADAEGMPIYLETHDEKNVAYYRRHGFELVHTGGIPDYGLKVWCMLRESR